MKKVEEQLTPYQQRFGDFVGPFLVLDFDFLGNEEVVFLFYDDGTSSPAFILSGSYGKLHWRERNKVGYSKWCFKDILGNDITPFDIKSKDELEMVCMLHPDHSNALKLHFSGLAGELK